MRASWKVVQGNAFSVLGGAPGRLFQSCVTYPPYWGLRDYGVKPSAWPEVSYAPLPGLPEITVPAMEACLGMEPTPEAYVAHLVAIFREVRRVLREDGTLWLNLGDSYARPPAKGGPEPLKPKDVVGIPWRVAFALQADGWWLRSDIVWAKPNAMPESVRDRPTKAHEYVFLLSKSERYFYDADAVAEPAINAGRVVEYDGTQKVAQDGYSTNNRRAPGNPGGSQRIVVGATRNRRTIWTITTRPFKQAHFATFPPELPEVCIKAGTSERGRCRECGAPWERVVERTERPREDFRGSRFDAGKTGARDGGDRAQPGERLHKVTTGWRPTCECGTDATAPCVVLDPFAGASTTGMVALRLGRSFVGIELSEDYAEMARERLRDDQPLMNVAAERSEP